MLFRLLAFLPFDDESEIDLEAFVREDDERYLK